jgi:hypothetical protein
MFTIHPTMTKYFLGLYNCVELDKDEFWLLNDLQIRCWEGSHLKYGLAIGIPAIAVWIIGLPILGLFYIRRNQLILQEPSFLRRFKMIYQGLR